MTFKTMRSSLAAGFTPIGLVLIGLALVAALYPAAIEGQLNPVFDEDGPVESLSAIGYLIAALLIVLMGGLRFASKSAFGIIIVLLFLAGRELNFHARFTTMGAMKTSFYLSESVPLFEKVAAASVLAFVGWAVLIVMLRHTRPFLAGLQSLQPTNIAVLFSITCAVLSESLDGLGSKLGDFGIQLQGQSEFLFVKMEETVELGIPLFAIAAVMTYFTSQKMRAIEAQKRGDHITPNNIGLQRDR